MREKKSITITHPTVACEWNYEKNTEIDINDYTYGSEKRVWWKCSKCGHEWQQTITNRTHGRGCPACSGRVAKKHCNDLLSLNPSLCLEWDYDNNYPYRPEDFKSGSGTYVGWICEKCGYQWVASINKRNRGTGCPACAGKDVWEGHNDLASNFPEMVAEWDFKNNEKAPWEYVCFSNAKVSWICRVCGHSWKSPINNRTSAKAGCPECAKERRWKTLSNNRIKIKKNSLANTRPDLAGEWDFQKNGAMKPDMFTEKSNRYVWWKCRKCGNEWSATIANRVSGRNCPACQRGLQTSLPEQIVYYYVKNCFMDAANSYVLDPFILDVYIPSYKICIEYDGERWHQNADKDYKKTEFLKQKGIIVIRIREPACPDIDDGSYIIKTSSPNAAYTYLDTSIEELVKILDKITGIQFNIIPNAHSIFKQLMINIQEESISNSISEKRKELCKEWDYEKNSPMLPEKIPYMSNKKFWWICPKCHCSWEAAVCDRSSGKGCPICAGQITVKGINDLKTKFPEIAEEWDYEENHERRPEEFTCGNDFRAHWRCKRCNHTWETSIYNRTHNKSGCPACARKKRMKYSSLTIIPG